MEKFDTHNTASDIDVNMTYKVASLDANYADLVKAFGKPGSGDGYKVDAEWEIRFKSDCVVATIHNYKDGPSYGGIPVEQIETWSVGAQDEKTAPRVLKLLADIHKNQSIAKLTAS